MSLSWKRKPKSKTTYEKKRQEQIDRIAGQLCENQCSYDKPTDKENIWLTAEKIAKSPLRIALFTCNRPFIKVEKIIWEPILTWADNQALLSLLGLVGNVGLIIAVGMYIGSEKQRRDTEVLTSWQTLTNAHSQPGNGGRIHALEFLNAPPRNKAYDYPGANWRRRASCLWICTWTPESLAGIDLSVESVDTPESDKQETPTNDQKPNNTYTRRVYLREIQLPGADLEAANFEGADLESANLKDADLEAANLKDADLGAANLEGANLWSANLEGADLEDTNLEGAYLGDSNFKDVYLRDTNFKDVYLGDTNLEGISLKYSNLEGAYLKYANLKGAFLGDTNLVGADLEAANLEGANLDSANLEGANLWSANLEDANLWSANLEDANLGSVNLEGANLDSANLEGTNLRSANLEGVSMEYANLEGANLDSANLEGIKSLTQDQISQARFCRTKLPVNIPLNPNRDCEELGIDPEMGN